MALKVNQVVNSLMAQFQHSLHFKATTFTVASYICYLKCVAVIPTSYSRSLPWGWTVAEWILKKVLEEVGLQHCEIFAAGAAPMRREVHEYFMSIDIPLMVLYGMSESSGPHTLNLIQPDGWKVGSCGKTIMGVQMKIADPDKNGEGEVSWKVAVM